MRERLFNDGWEFKKTGLSCTEREIYGRNDGFYRVTLPHDWLIYNVKDLYGNGMGWYRRVLTAHDLAKLSYVDGERVCIRFDGVYMNSSLFVNGNKVCDWKYGYSAFGADITEFLKDGENEILVRVIHESPNSRWYSGAGIFRDVFLRVMPKTHLVYDGTYVHTTKTDAGFRINISTEIGISRETARSVHTLSYSLTDASGNEVATKETETNLTYTAGEDGKDACTIRPGNEEDIVSVQTSVNAVSPHLWDINSPELYRLNVYLKDAEGTVTDSDRVTVGFRTTEFDPERGFLLNGRSVKVHGVCEHHDLGALGSAFSVPAMKRKIRILKEMGVNAIRTSHNMPAKALMDIADEEGILILSEAFDMWERKKTDYDYARFFNEWCEKDVRSWIRRDRNHPSVIMWSIGNEIYDTHADPVRAQEIIDRLVRCVKENDPLENGHVTLCSNFLAWENTQKCMNTIKLAGYNYTERLYEEHHKEYPDWIIYGSETSSLVSSRGVYKFPYTSPFLSDDDEQCSALGNSNTSWGAKSFEHVLADDRDTKCCFGQFVWSGFDYIGEPTPYHTKNSYFGVIDTAGFPKDPYYFFKSEWTDAKKTPFVHVFPYWDFNPGEPVDVRICSNLAEVELFVNGRSAGTKKLDHTQGREFTATFTVPYERGQITAKAYDETGNTVAEETRHSFSDATAITALPDKEVLAADGKDICFIEISAEDINGYPVENAMNYIRATVSGPAFIAGMDNGDSSDFDEYKTNVRKLFNGRLLLMVRAENTPGEITVRLTGQGLKDKVLRLCAKRNVKNTGEQCPEEIFEYIKSAELPANRPVRKLELSSSAGKRLTKKNNTSVVSANVYPSDATDRNVEFVAVNDGGIEIGHVKLERLSGTSVRVIPEGDGNFSVRAFSRSGTDKIKIISTLRFTAEGFGEPFLDPYSFVSAGLYSEAVGEIGNGNEKGISTASAAKSAVVFNNIDFGQDGSDEVTIPVFALSDEPFYFKMYEGRPCGQKAVLEGVYHKKMIWNVYQEETYKLNRVLTGVRTISIEFTDKVHIKGFLFKKKNRAFDVHNAAECTHVYGDSFVKEEKRITGIGNNVTVEFPEFDFGNEGAKEIRIKGSTPLQANTVHLKLTGIDGDEKRLVLEFKKTCGYEEQSFETGTLKGRYKVCFVFLPGSDFSMESFMFCQNVGQREGNK